MKADTVSPNATVRDRWSALKPHIQVFGASGPRPTALLFHGCGGIRSQIYDYAQAANDVGWRAVVVDSYAPRSSAPVQTKVSPNVRLQPRAA